MRHLALAAAFSAAIFLLMGDEQHGSSHQSAAKQPKNNIENNRADLPGAAAPRSAENTGTEVKYSEVAAGRIEDSAAAALKRTNFEAFLRYQQRLSAGQKVPQSLEPQARRAEAEERIKQRLETMLEQKQKS